MPLGQERGPNGFGGDSSAITTRGPWYGRLSPRTPAEQRILYLWAKQAPPWLRIPGQACPWMEPPIPLPPWPSFLTPPPGGFPPRGRLFPLSRSCPAPGQAPATWPADACPSLASGGDTSLAPALEADPGRHPSALPRGPRGHQTDPGPRPPKPSGNNRQNLRRDGALQNLDETCSLPGESGRRPKLRPDPV